jgi:predicted  nucleic acid-binding Zn-ribbon protein
MGLDFIIHIDNQWQIQFAMNEDLHSKIFSKSTNWRSFKQLKKISDYYKTDAVFNSNELTTLIADLMQITQQIDDFQDELQQLITKLRQKNAKLLRVTSD